MKRVFVLFCLVLSFISIIWIIYPLLKRETPSLLVSTPSPYQVPTPTLELNADRLFQLVNEWRVKEGYQPYIKSDDLCKVAEDRADDAIPDNHAGLYEKYSNYPYVIQENLVYGYSSEEDSLSGWLGSPGHLSTLRKNYKFSCVACYELNCSEIFSNF